jgi:uncharacterized membrane protein YphA (DoxX/SURF4 family)
MSLVRRIARPALAAPFVFEGVRTALKPERELEVAPGAFAQADKALQSSPAPSFVDARTIIRLTGVVAAGAGIVYAVGKQPRTAAAVLLATTSVGLAGRKKVWQLKGEARTQEIQSILTDIGLIGGVLLAVVDRDGKPSLGYRWNEYLEDARKNAAEAQKELEKRADKAAKSAKKSAKSTAEKVEKAL